MEVKLVKRTDGELIYEVSIKLDKTSMLQSENEIQAAVNVLGNEATQAVLSAFDTDGRDIEIEGDNYTVKSYEKKNIRHLTEK